MSSSDKKDKGVIRELTEFYNSSKNFMINCDKPDRKGKIS
jgi:hypothetical protein